MLYKYFRFSKKRVSVFAVLLIIIISVQAFLTGSLMSQQSVTTEAGNSNSAVIGIIDNEEIIRQKFSFNRKVVLSQFVLSFGSFEHKDVGDANNDLMTLDVSQCFRLKELNCSGNQLMELDVGHQTQLTQLDCSNNKLTELNVKQNGGLTSLLCNDNQLKTLDLSQNHSLSHLNCAKNRLACVDVTGISGTITADGNRRPIAVRTDGTFDLTTLPGFDVSKATGWNGGSVSGTTLSVNAGADEVSYQYDCGNGVNPTFIFETSLPINEDNFPDPNFRNYIKTYKAGGRDVLTVEEQRKVETIEVEGKNISNLKGIEAFPQPERVEMRKQFYPEFGPETESKAENVEMQ